MSAQNPYFKKLHGAALQSVFCEKEEGWKSRTARDSFMGKLQYLELIGIKIKNSPKISKQQNPYKCIKLKQSQ